MAEKLPPCGIYRTGRALASDPEHVPKGALIKFHNHSDRGIPMLQAPKDNFNNVWTFHAQGPGIEGDPEFIEALVPLKPEGLYVLSEHIHTPKGVIPGNALVQLGYNRSGHPILFLPKVLGNGLQFPEQGSVFEDLGVLELLSDKGPLWVGEPVAED
jgi:hypothetical protein